MVIHQILPQEIQQHKLSQVIFRYSVQPLCMLTRFMYLSLYNGKENPCPQMEIAIS